MAAPLGAAAAGAGLVALVLVAEAAFAAGFAAGPFEEPEAAFAEVVDAALGVFGAAALGAAAEPVEDEAPAAGAAAAGFFSVFFSGFFSPFPPVKTKQNIVIVSKYYHQNKNIKT